MSDIHTTSVPASQTGQVIAKILASPHAKVPMGEPPSTQSVERSVMVQAELITDKIAEEWGRMQGKGMGFDKTTIYQDRSFKEVHLLGAGEGKDCCKCVAYVELDPTMDPLVVLVNVLRQVQGRQMRRGVPVTQLYEVEHIVIDNAPDGKGAKNGLGVRFNRCRREDYDNGYPSEKRIVSV